MSMHDAHGGPVLAELRELGINPGSIIDFSVSTNPYGPHPEMRRALRDAAVELYPDPTALTAREALSRMLDVSVDCIATGNGAAELLWAAARAFLAPGDCFVSVEPTFSELQRAAAAVGARSEPFVCAAERNFTIDLAALGAHLERVDAALVYLCSPSTPIGAHTPVVELAHFATEHAKRIFVLDQSFLSLSEAWQERAVTLPSNVLVVRSVTKDHAIPGARAGYAIGKPALIDGIAAQRPAWSTSALAEAALIAAERLEGFVAQSRTTVLDDRRALTTELEAIGLRVIPSCTAFVAVELGAECVPSVRKRLLQGHGLQIRDCASFGLPAYARIAARPEADRGLLVAALRRELGA